MLKNYLKIAVRNFANFKLYSAINIVGLAIGVMCTILITLFILEELSYDNFHKYGDQIYRLTGEYDQGGGEITASANTTYQLAPQLKVQLPQIEKAVRIDPNNEQVIRYEDQLFRQSNIMYADSGFFDMFSFKLVSGKRKAVLAGSNSAVISTGLAEQIFGSGDVIGRRLEVDESTVQVAAVMEPMPDNAHFHSDLIISMAVAEDLYPKWVRRNWSGTSHYTYLLLEPKANPKQVQQQINRLWDENLQDFAESHQFYLQPLTDIHLRSNLAYEIEANGNAAYLYIFGFAGLIVLVMACINYMNLATARTIDRTKEVGIRKVLGADKKQIRTQFFSESIVTAGVAVFAGLLFSELTLPYLNMITGETYAINWEQGLYWGIGLLLLAGIIGFVSASYPAFLVSLSNAAQTLKGGTSSIGLSGGKVRKGLVLVQFSASIAILISTAVVYKQLDYLRNKNLGIKTSQLVTIPFQTSEVGNQYEAIRDRLVSHSDIISVSASNNALSGRVTHWRGYDLQGRDETVTVPTMIVARDFFETVQAELIAGRTFSEEFTTDKDQAYVINEAAAAYLGLDDPVGVSLKGSAFTGSEWSVKDAKIIGVIRDFHMASLHEKIQPTVFSLTSEKTTPLSYMTVRLSGENLGTTLEFLEETWQSFTQEYPFTYEFLDQQLAQQYRNEERFLSIFGGFALLAILVSCFGVFGLAAFAANRRRKEFGIRKVLGASGKGIVWLVSREYALLVLVANVIAWPVAWWFMRDWLQDFAYQVNLEIWEFMGMGVMAFIIIILTVSYQALKAAGLNPVESLRSE